MHRGFVFVLVSASLSCGGRTTAAPSDAYMLDAPASTADTGAVDTRVPTPDAACSDARWPLDTAFAFERGSPTDAPACTPHCGANRPASSMWPGDFLTCQALPYGACTEGDLCAMTVEWVGPCPDESTARGPLDLFLCRCKSGRWTCTVDDASPSGALQTCDAPSH